MSPYLTAYVLHVFQVADTLKYTVDAEVMQRAYTYLEGELAKAKPENESWIPAYTAWQAFAIKVLVEGGRNQDSHITRLYGYLDRMPVFGLTYLADAMVAKGEGGPRLAELRRRMKNAVLPEGGSAHVEELNDPYLLWFWNSNVRSTAIVLESSCAAVDAGPRPAGDGALDAGGAEERPLGQHAGERLGDGGPGHLLPHAGSGGAGLQRRGDARRRQAAGAGDVQGALGHGVDEDRADADAARRAGRPVPRATSRSPRPAPAACSTWRG